MLLNCMSAASAALMLTAAAWCAGAGTPGLYAEDSPMRVIRNVPFYPQKKNQCGPASLAGVMVFRGVFTSPEEIAAEIYSPTAGGSLDSDLRRYAVRKGLHAEQYRGSVEDLKAQIDRGNPVIVLVDTGFLSYRAHHFMVIIGYDGRGVIANSGIEQSRRISMQKFLDSWGKTDFWTLLILPGKRKLDERK